MYRTVDNLRSQYPVCETCRVLGVSRSGYYAWRSRPESARRREDRCFKIWIRSSHRESNGAYGARRIHQDLQDQGIDCGRHRVGRLMSEEGLAGRKRRRYRVTTLSEHDRPVAPNVLDRQFEQDEVNRAWVADITYIASRQGWLYLFAVMDLASRRVVGWSLSRSMRAAGATHALHRALLLRKPPKGLVHHSDRGRQYASEEYQDLLASVGAVSSMSRKGNCWDNAVIESFFSTLKTECVTEPYASLEEAEVTIGGWIEGFYNTRRRHSSLSYLSPLDFERSLAERCRSPLVLENIEEAEVAS